MIFNFAEYRYIENTCKILKVQICQNITTSKGRSILPICWISKVVNKNVQLRRRFATKCPTNRNPPQPKKHIKTADHRHQLQRVVRRLFLDIQMEGFSDPFLKLGFR
jgi:hypothetical protein